MRNLFLLLIVCLASLAIRQPASAQSVFEAPVGWSSPYSPAVLFAGEVWFRVLGDMVEFQAVLQDPVGQIPSLQPVFLLNGSELPFSFGAGQRLVVAHGFNYHNPFVPVPPFDPFGNMLVTDNYFEGTSFSGSFQVSPGFESQLLAQGATLRIGYAGGSVSGTLEVVSVPEPSTWMLTAIGGLTGLTLTWIRRTRKL